VAGRRASGAGGHGGRPEPDESADGPVDLAAVRSDDALLDAVRGGSALAPGFGRAADDEPLADLLAAWRAEAEAEPMPELVTLDEAMAAVRSGQDALRRRHPARRLPFLVAAAAVGAVAVLGLGTAVHQATPGQPLWGVTQVVFSSRAESVQRQYDARTAIEQADDALAQGNVDAARTALRNAEARIRAVDSEDQAALREERDRVIASLAPPAADAAPTPAPAPTSATSPERSATTSEPSTTTTTPVPKTTTTPGASGPEGTPGATTTG